VTNAHILEELLERYLLHMLSEDQLALVEEHLFICEACQEYLTEIEEYVSAVKVAGRQIADQQQQHVTSRLRLTSRHAKTVLIVEDNEADLYLVRRALKEHAPSILPVVLRSGDDAINFVQLQRVPEVEPRAVLLDLRLPGSDGIEVLRAIRSSQSIANVPVIVLTDGASITQQAEIRSMGAAYRLKGSKLADFSNLAAEVGAICDAC